MDLFGNKKKKEKEEIEKMEDNDTDQNILRNTIVQEAAKQSFRGDSETPMELMNNLIEPASQGIYGSEKMYREGLDKDGEKVVFEEIKKQVKILRDLPLGNFTAMDEALVDILLDLAENCEDMEMYDAATYFVEAAYIKINATRGRAGFLTKQLGTKSIELTRKSEHKKTPNRMFGGSN